MKDLQLKDIFKKQAKPLTRVSVYVNGRWSFANLKTPTRISANTRYYLISTVFGLHKKGSTSPSNYAVKGSPGDYISLDNGGVLALVPASQYALLFPGPQQKPAASDNSNQIRNPNFLTKMQAESVDKDSDKVLIGDRVFSVPSTQKKTLTIIETPTGQSQVFYDASAGAMVFDYESGTMVEAPVPDKPY